MNALGWVMLSVPFVVFFCFMVSQAGWRVALTVYGLTALVVGWIVVGAHLAAGA